MNWTRPRSSAAGAAWSLAESLQTRMVDNLTRVSQAVGTADSFTPIEWLRDDGRHGGGVRYVAVDGAMFNRASVNVSSVHYDDLPDKRLSSATALSTIIHPQHPRAPSFHMHISWTEMRDGTGYWRVMADLNPSLVDDDATTTFTNVLRETAPSVYDRAVAEGDKYFFVPVLKRHRGVAHYYLEGYQTGDFGADESFAKKLGDAAADCYASLVEAALSSAAAPTADERQTQLEYHTLYLLQVLTLDRGTTSGLLVHDQNDVGILGSLPTRIDRNLLASWVEKLPSPQDELLRNIVGALTDTAPCTVDNDARAVLAKVVRDHYRAHPDALRLQAAGSVIPTTVGNHQR